MGLPQTGLKKDDVLAQLEGFHERDLDWRSGRLFGFVYDPGPEVLDVAQRAYLSFLTENGLDPTTFPSLLQLENEVIDIARQQLRGDSEVVGTFTSGGTESIILAVKAARDWARVHKPHIREPEMVLPLTAHAAFQKAAQYLGLKTVLVPVDANRGYVADVGRMAEAITENTIFIMGSAISYAHGRVDPIPELARLALEKDVWMHVDACVGGWILPYFRELGVSYPDFDFTVPGVRSISMDLHKYAFCPKGASTVLYRNKALRQHQIFTCTTWTGYSIVNPTVQSSKTGGPIAAAWAVLHHLGADGYRNIATKCQAATQRIVAGIKAIPGLRLLAEPHMSMLAFTADGVSVFHIADAMKARGWYIQPQLAFGGSPASLHLCVTPAAEGLLDGFLSDLAESVDVSRPKGASALAAMVRDAFANVDPQQLTPEMFTQLLAMGGLNGVEIPNEMAEVNETLNALPTGLRARLLTEFINALFNPNTTRAAGVAP